MKERNPSFVHCCESKCKTSKSCCSTRNIPKLLSANPILELPAQSNTPPNPIVCVVGSHGTKAEVALVSVFFFVLLVFFFFDAPFAGFAGNVSFWIGVLQ